MVQADCLRVLVDVDRGAVLRHAGSAAALGSGAAAVIVEVDLVVRLHAGPLVERLVLLGVSGARLGSFRVNWHVSEPSVGAEGDWCLFCVIVSCNDRFLSAAIDDSEACLVVSRAFGRCHARD